MAAVELYNTSLWNDANLKAYYRAEDLTDNKPSGSFTLTNHNSVAFNAGQFGNGFDLGTSNTNKYLDIADNLGLAGNSDATIIYWVKLNTEIGSGIYQLSVNSSTTGADRYISIYYEFNGGTRRLQFDCGGTSSTSNLTMGTADWYHIALTRNVTGNTKLGYVNGSQVVTSALGSSGLTANLFNLGAYPSSNPASAIFDDVAVFNRVLSATEISNYYNGTLGPASHPTSGGAFLQNFL